MFAKDLQKELINWTVSHSGHLKHRGFIGLSEIAICERIIFENFMLGKYASLDEHLKIRVGFELEAKLIERLKALGVYGSGEEIELYDGLVQGHTDGVIKGQDLLEIKTVPLESYLPDRKRLPEKTFWQVQAYLHFTKRDWAHVIYLARDTGVPIVIGLHRQERMGQKILNKLERVVEAIHTGIKPACTCGRCR